MQYRGKVLEFNRATRRGIISSKAYGGQIPFHGTQVLTGSAGLEAGGRVEFCVGAIDGVLQALKVSMTTQLAPPQLKAGTPLTAPA